METITPEIVDEKSPLKLVIKENNLELDSAKLLVSSFEPLLQEAKKWAERVANINVTDASQTREMKLARETRLALRRIRIDTEDKRKSLKENSLRYSRALDGAANIIKFLVVPLEEKLEAQEKFVELQEKKRKDELKQTRLMLLAPFGTDTSFYSLDEMPETVFQQLLTGEQASAEKKKAEAQRIENERIESERQKALAIEATRVENEKLKAEAQRREVAARLEREMAQEALKAAQETAKKEKELAESKAATALAEERKKAQEAAQRLAELQKKEKEETAKQLQAAEAARKKAEADAKALADAAKKKEDDAKASALREKELQEEAIRKAAAAPDKQKLLRLANQIRSLELDSISSTTLTAEIQSQVEKFALWIEKKANSL